MTSMISIVDATQAYYSSSNSFKVVVSDHEDNVVMLNGNKALAYLAETLLSGYSSIDSASSDSGIMPPGVRMVGKNYIVFERPPTYQNIFYNPDKVHSQMSDQDVQVFRIPMPWQIYIASFTNDYYVSEVSMYFSNTSLMSKEQHLYLAPLPNFYTNGSLCRPMFSDMTDVERYPKNLSGVMACAYDWIWNNGTNNDLNEAMVHVNLQIASKGLDGYNSTIFSKMTNEEYRSTSFTNTSGITYYHSTQVTAMLRAWEKSTLEEVISYSWPVPSVEKHFHQRYYYDYNPDITEHSSYYNWLAEWAQDYYDGESSEDIEYMLENGEYDGDAYYEYVVNNHISLSPPEFKNLTCAQIISNFNDAHSNPNIKNTFASYVLKAFEKAQNTSTQTA